MTTALGYAEGVMQMRFHQTVRTFLLGVAAATLFAAGALAADKQVTVVELYTSQGCSSCPPADANLGRLAERDDIVALGFHVDYWDYIGWKDPYADPAYTQRQRDYAGMMGGRYVYTPQMIIQGSIDAVGSDDGAIARGLEKAAALPRVPIKLNVDAGAKTVTVSIPSYQTMENHAVLLALYDEEHSTPVKRGENGGRTLRNYHVVRSLQPIATWRGKALDVPVDLSKMAKGKSYACAVLLQSRETGRILGAAQLELPDRIW